MVVSFVAEVGDLAILHVHPGGVHDALRRVLPAEGRDEGPPLQSLVGCLGRRVPGGYGRVENGELAVPSDDGGRTRLVALVQREKDEGIVVNCVMRVAGMVVCATRR